MTLPLAKVRAFKCTFEAETLTFSSTADYTPLVSSELTFGPTAITGSTQCTSASLVDDDIVEDTEQFSVEVSSTSDIVLIASPSSAIYSIADNVDSESLFSPALPFMSCCTAVVVSLARSSYAGYEELDGIEVCVQLQQGVMEGVNATVQLTTQSGTASEGIDLHR